MAGYNLVHVGTEELASGGFANLTYGCDNFEGILIDIDKTTTGTFTNNTVPADLMYITILAGTETIMNRVPVSALASLNQFESGTGFTDDFVVNTDNTNGQAYFEIDTGCHYLDKGAELSVQISQEATASAQTPAVTFKVYAKVNGVAPPSPQKWLWRTDNAFMLPLVETLYAFGSDLPDNTDNVTMQYGTENVLVPIAGGATLINCDTVGDDPITNMSLCYDGIPRDMQINTASSGISFLAQVKEVASNQQVAKARRWIPNKFKSLTPKEKVVLAQGH
tara:strand:- start:984 stop:1820 length:837 start_codon:yes stop_codon:yes gene_type:complete